MPNVTQQVDSLRIRWSADWVNNCIKRGMAGEAGWFYAIENGWVIGAPFTNDQVTDQLLRRGVALGQRFALVLRPPAETDQKGQR